MTRNDRKLTSAELCARAVADATVFAALLGVIGMILVTLVGCGSTRDQQTKTVEIERVTTSAVTLDTPIGPVTLQPTQVTRQRQQDEVTQEDRRYIMPDAGPIIQAAAATTPWGGILAGVVGLATTAFAGKKAMDAGRQRNELIDGIERAKADLGDKWSTLTSHLEAEQNSDTKAAVKARTA